jgi:glycosyltransferase involved in cell wall biosynthesis
VGRIDRVKGLHVLLESLSYLDFNTQVVIIGPVIDSKYFEQIEKKSSEINKQGFHKVNYLGEMGQKGLIPWYQKATVLARPDLIGASGAGVSTLEALACGTPVIGVKNHVVRDGVNGFIVPANDPRKFAEALRKLLVDQTLRQRYSRAGRRIIEETFSLESAVTTLIKVYKAF